MKRFTLAMIALLFAMALPLAATAMDHDSHDKGMSKDMNHDMKMGKAEDKAHDMHKGHDMGSKDKRIFRYGKRTQKGVIATAKVKTYDEKTLATMAKMGMNSTHHVMVFFTDAKSGAAIDSGKVAIKVKGEDAKPVMMILMGTGFGGDVTVGDGMATFEVGTKLEDGKKRQFSIMFHNM